MNRVLDWARRARSNWSRRRYEADPSRPLARAAARAAGMSPIRMLPRVSDAVLWPDGQDALLARAADVARGRFSWLNREADFSAAIRWRDQRASSLWVEQLHRLAIVADLARSERTEDARRILASWRTEFEESWDPMVWHPHPTSQRLVNLCVAAACAGGFGAFGPGTDRLAAMHAAYLAEHVERAAGGHRLLENARALLWAGRAFQGGMAAACERLARSILEQELGRQVLADGGHVELSPMVHCIVLRNLLEIRELLPQDDPLVVRHVAPAVRRMGEFLAGIVCPDGDIPLLGDSARNFGPPPRALLQLLALAPADFAGVRSFPDSGLHVLRQARVWAILDAGHIPSQTPARAQADTLTIEVWVDGSPVVCDPGVFDYADDDVWSRSSRAHSTVTVDDRDTSDLDDPSGRGRCSVMSVAIAEGGDEVVATIRPQGETGSISRSVRLYGESLTIEDRSRGIDGTVRSRLHLAPGLRFVAAEKDGAVVGACSEVADIDTGGRAAHFEEGRVAPEFGRRIASRILVQEARGDDERMVWVIGPA